MNTIRIVSGGTASTTDIFAINTVTGEQMKLDGVIKIEFMPLTSDQEVKAVLTFFNVQMDIIAKVE